MVICIHAALANDKKAQALKSKGYQTLFGLKARSYKGSRERFRFFRPFGIYLANEFELKQSLNAIAILRAFPLRPSLLDLPVCHPCPKLLTHS